MSVREKCKTIVFNWKIENFSYRKDEKLFSPYFGPESINDEVWRVTISTTNDHISLSVDPVITSQYSAKYLSCLVAFLDSHSNPVIWKERKPICDNYFVFRSFISTWSLNSNKTKFLPNDTLTIQCFLVGDPPELSAPVSRFAHTQIEPPVNKMFTWEVVGLGSLQPNDSLKLSKNISDGESVTIELLLSKYNSFDITATTSFIIKSFAKIEVAMLDASGNKIEIGCQETTIHGDWRLVPLNNLTFCAILTKHMLKFYSNQFLHADTLYLHFTIGLFSRNVIFNRMVDESEYLTIISRTTADVKEISENIVCAEEHEINQVTVPQLDNTISQVLQEVLKQGFLSDFNLTVGSRVFPVHKVILGARSQFFREKFIKETKEKEDSCLEIRDVDADTLQRLLQLIYSDILDEDMGWERVSSLYAAANTYGLQEPLKQRCSAIIKSGLCVSNILEMLLLADMHQDQDLKSGALDFILLNDRSIIGSERWMNFEEKNAKLAVETCRKLYLIKING